MSAKADLYLCMGSACHQYGVYQVLPRLQSLLREYGLDDRVELKGAFCLGTCTDGIVLRFGDHYFYGVNAANLDDKFKNEIMGRLAAHTRR